MTEQPSPKERSEWLSRLFSENPKLLALRERVLPWTGGYSFANVIHTDTTAVLSHVNRHRVLELVYQHLKAIGMHRTAETMKRESGHEFQVSDRPWDKTDLLLLVSLGVLPREDPWVITSDPHHQFVEENLEEDFFASKYREDLAKLGENLQKWFDDKFDEVIWKDDACKTDKSKQSFDQMVAASLQYLILFVVTGNCGAVDEELKGAKRPDEDLERFCLILHSMTSSLHFLEHLLALFNCDKLAEGNPEFQAFLLQKRPRFRRNIIDILRKWVKFHGRFIGHRTLKAIEQFTREIVDNPEIEADINRFAKALLNQVQKPMGISSNPDTTERPPEPEIPVPQIIFRPALRIIDPDPKEVARQITLMFHTAFRAVHSREFMVALGSKGTSHQTPTLTEFFEFSERLTLLCLETILTCEDKTGQGQTIWRLLQIAKELANLRNYAAAACLVRAVGRREFSSLPIWKDEAESKKTLKDLSVLSGNDSDQTLYRKEVKDAYDRKDQPAILNLDTEVNDEKSEPAPDFIEGPDQKMLINWQERWRISKTIARLHQFQNQSYNFWAIPQIQKVINRGPQMTKSQIEEKLAQFDGSSSK